MTKIKWDSPETQINTEGDIPSMTLFVDLPSKGLYYPPDLFYYNLEQLEIKYVTGKEESILINKEYARNGVTIDKFVTSLMIDDRMKLPQVVNSLMLADITAIAIAGRNSAYGPEYKVKSKCPNCGNIDESSYDLSYPKQHCGFHDNLEYLEDKVEWLSADKFRIFETPLKKDQVVFRLLNHKDELNMRKTIRSKATYGFKEQYLPLILSVNEKSEKSAISDYLDNAPAYDLKYVRNIINQCTPSLDLKQEYYCSSCGYTEQDFEIPITENFFLPR